MAEPNHPDLRRVRLAPEHWYPFATSRQLPPGQMLPVQFSADPIVLVRTRSGQLFALEDRCAHRQMPLSRGRLKGEQLQCTYHGRCYDANGRCLVPEGCLKASALPGVRSYPVREHNHLIFVFPGESAAAAEVSVPDIPEARSGAFLCMPFQREVRCHYSFLHENLMDMSHQTLHRRWTGRFNPRILRTDVDDRRVSVDYSADFRAGSALLRLLPGLILRLQAGSNGGRQACDEVTVTTDYPYQCLVYRRPGIDEPLLKLWNAYIPVGAKETITRPVGLLLVRKPVIPGLLTILRPLLLHVAEQIFDEDREAMELEQCAYEAQGGDWTRETAPFLLHLRRLLLTQGQVPDSSS